MPPNSDPNLFQPPTPTQVPPSSAAQAVPPDNQPTPTSTPADTITTIAPLTRDPNRATIKVAGRPVATLPITIISDLVLSVGQPWTPAAKAKVDAAVQFDNALRAALTRLNYRQYSTRELQTRLKRLKHPADIIDRVIEHLTDRHLLDDTALGQELIRQSTARSAAAPKLLQAKLYKRGLSQPTIDRLLQDNAQDHDALLTAALDQARKKARPMADLPPQTRRRRLWAQLARRGFDNDTIEQALSAIDARPSDETVI